MMDALQLTRPVSPAGKLLSKDSSWPTCWGITFPGILVEHRPDSQARKYQKSVNGIKKRAATQELIQSWLSFSVLSVLGPGFFPFGSTRNQTSAERSWAPDRMRQVKRPRSRRTCVSLQDRYPLSQTKKQTNPKTERTEEKGTANFWLSSAWVSSCCRDGSPKPVKFLFSGVKAQKRHETGLRRGPKERAPTPKLARIGESRSPRALRSSSLRRDVGQQSKETARAPTRELSGTSSRVLSTTSSPSTFLVRLFFSVGSDGCEDALPLRMDDMHEPRTRSLTEPVRSSTFREKEDGSRCVF